MYARAVSTSARGRRQTPKRKSFFRLPNEQKLSRPFWPKWPRRAAKTRGVSTALSSDVKGSPVASVAVKIPKGESRQLKFTAAVQSRSPRPFRFGGWKGSYRAGGVTKTFQAFDDCEVDSSKCDDDEFQPENAVLGLTGKGNNYRN